MVENTGAFCDPDDSGNSGCNDAWIEIYNAGLLPVDLSNMYISDDANNPQKHRITGSLIIPPLGHAVIWADGQLAQGANHTNFVLNPAANTIVLSDTTGGLIDTMSLSQIPSGATAGRLPDGTSNIETFTGPTLEAENIKRPGLCS